LGKQFPGISVTAMKRSPLATLFLSLSAATAAYAGALAKDTPVRIEGSGIEAGWFEGKIFVTEEGCTMVRLSKPTKDKYTMIALVAVARLQKKEGAAWSDISLQDLRTHEPKRCLVEGSD
jgi:hypothetical protein